MERTNEATKTEAKRLWIDIFGDDEAFVDLFFTRKYAPERLVYRRQNGRIVSLLHALPYSVRFCGRELSLRYISGACTLPEMRGKGMMGELLQEALEGMRKEGAALVTLIPKGSDLYRFYEQNGYAAVVCADSDAYVREPASTGAPFPDIPDEALFSLYDTEQRKRRCCVLHDRDDFDTIRTELALSGGALVPATDKNGTPTGIAFAYPQPDHVLIKDAVFRNKTAFETLLQRTADRFGTPCIRYRHDRPAPDASPLGLARIVDPRPLLAAYAAAYPETECRFRITDDRLPGNSGPYELRNGNCTRLPDREPRNGSVPEITVPELTAMLIGPARSNSLGLHPQQLFESLMLD